MVFATLRNALSLGLRAFGDDPDSEKPTNRVQIE